MIKIYSLKRCASCKKTIEWFKFHNLEFEEIDIKKGTIGSDNFVKLLSLTDGGVLDIISTKCQEFYKIKNKIDELHLTEFIDFIDHNRQLLKHPLIINDTCIQIGYNSEQIRCFIPSDIRKINLHK